MDKMEGLEKTSEIKSFSVDFIKERMLSLIQDNESVGNVVKNFDIKGVNEEITLNTSIKKFGVNIGIQGTLQNKGDGIAVKNYKIDAVWPIKGKAEKIIGSKLNEISEMLKSFIKKEENKEVEKIWIEDGQLKVMFKKDEFKKDTEAKIKSEEILVKPEIKEEAVKKEEDLKRKELFERISKYREKEKFYNEEKIRLNNLSQTLNKELKLSQKKDEEDYLASLEKEKTSPENTAEVEITKEEAVNVEKIPKKNEALSDVDKVIEEIPNEEKKIIEKAMEEDTPMEFESPKVKTNYKDFIKNNIVKLVSGFKISSKIKNIIERNAKKILMTTAVLTLWTSGNSFVKPSDVEGDIFSLKKKEVLDTVNKTLEISDVETYNKLSENGKRIYLYASSKIEGSYVIVDKPSATLSIIGADKKLIGQMPVLLGQTRGETPNMSDPESDTAVQATTPAGKYTLLRLAGEEDLITYKGKVFSLCGSDALALHITYPPEKEKRTEALNTPTSEDNRMSWGCINIDEKMWAKYIEGKIKDRGAYVFITPDNPIMSLNPETGKVEKGNYNFLAMNNINN